MKPKALCRFMNLGYRKYRDYVIRHVRSGFVSDLKSSQGLKRKFHHWEGARANHLYRLIFVFELFSQSFFCSEICEWTIVQS
jgi:hypothetical protein